MGVAHGLFRDTDGWVRVRYDDGHEMDLTGTLYVAANYAPPFHKLPLVAHEVGEQRRAGDGTPH
jgi:hypothetical protein